MFVQLQLCRVVYQTWRSDLSFGCALTCSSRKKISKARNYLFDNIDNSESLLEFVHSTKMSTSGDFGNPLRKFKLVFLGEQSGQ